MNNQILPKAQDQVRSILTSEETLNSTTSGVVMKVTGQVKSNFRVKMRELIQKASLYLNEAKKEQITLLAFDEAFGVRNRVHLLFHLASLKDYEELVKMGLCDGSFQSLMDSGFFGKEEENWDSMFVEGSVQSLVMLPQFRRMYGADDSSSAEVSKAVQADKPFIGLPPAYHQFTLPLDELIHSANSGIMIHRSAQMKYEFRSEGRQFAREVVDSINTKCRGEATSFLYEEAFGAADRLHWLIHMKSVESYYPLIKMHAVDPEVRELYFKETLPAEKGGGNWSRMFVEGSMIDTAFMPQIWK